MEYKVIDVKTNDATEKRILEEIDVQYNDICKSVKGTRSLKRVMFSNPVAWQETDSRAAALDKAPLLRMTPTMEHDVYSKLDNVVVVCMKGDKIIGFLGGVVNAFDILVKHYENRHLESYDRMKYGNVYSYLVANGSVEPPMSWIEIICVHPEGRGNGISVGLIDTFIAHSKSTQKTSDLVVGLDIVGTLDNGINLGLKKIYEGLGFDFGMEGNRGDVPMMFSGAQFAGKRV
jgi:hypothetical protein